MSNKLIPIGQPSPFDGNPDKNLDGPAILSRNQHRLYRQGYIYRMRLTISVDDPNTYFIYALKNTWMTRNAYNKAHEAYLNNSKEERAVLGKNMIARWEDFRVEISSPQVFGLDGISLLPDTSGEHLESQVTDEAGNEYEFSFAAGPSAGTKLHITAEYDKMANTQKSPEGPASSVAYGALDDHVSFAQSSNLQQTGDEPPYNPDSIQTDNFHLVAILTASGNNSRLSTGFIDVPCGHMIISGLAANSQPMFLEFQSGKYKGVQAEKMGTPKLVKNHYEVK